MTTKVLTGAYASGYLLQRPIDTLRVARSGYVEGYGVTTSLTETATFAVVNEGRITVAADQYAIYLEAGGSVTNGSARNTSAEIQGRVTTAYGPGVVTNFGTILETLPDHQAVYLSTGGSLTNGSNADRSAEIMGWRAVGVYNPPTYSPTTVKNFATLVGTIGSGIFLAAGESVVTNGSREDTTALIRGGSYGVHVGVNASATVKNFATIESLGFLGGVGFDAGGILTNGSRNDSSAVIRGYDGVRTHGPATITNFATILGTGVAGGSGVSTVFGASKVTNGGRADATALIEGYTGVTIGAGSTATVTNFGTITGTGGTAVRFGSSADVLVVEAGSAFVGQVLGDGGTLDLASGVGAFSLRQAADGNVNVTVSGSMAPTTFTNFATLEIGSRATFTLAGRETIAAGQSLIDAGTLTVSGRVVQTGSVTVGGPTSRAAKLTIAAGAVWDIENNSNILLGLSTASRLEIQGRLIKSAGSLASGIDVKVIDAGRVVAASGMLTFTNTLAGTGVMLVRSGASLEALAAVGAGLRMAFKGGDANLSLGDPAEFAATIHGFAPTDTIDLLVPQATSATLGAGDTLVISNGATVVATLQLAGDYRGDTFNVASDGNGGTNLTVSTGAAVSASAGHQFIAAMAGFGAREAAAGAAPGDLHAASSRPMLASPGMAHLA